MSTPIVFISYSHDSEEHRDWVLKLASDLRTRGIEVILDLWDLPLGGDLVQFMEASIAKAERVLLICTERYVSKANSGDGGVGYERLIISAELVDRIDTRKFIPVVRNASKDLPRFLGARRYLDFSSSKYEATLEELARELHGTQLHVKPPLGPNPYSGTALQIDRSPAGDSGTDPSGKAILDQEWFWQSKAAATKGLVDTAPGATMEIRSALYSPLKKSQVDLLQAVRKAEIKTFGWPIAVLLEAQERFRPKPVSDGIRAEVAIKDQILLGHTSYDYWYLRSTGDFYLLHSLFEDSRDKGAIFFNTRIVRVAESLLFLSGLYANLGVTGDSKVCVRIGHEGLAQRELKSSTPNRHLSPRRTEADKSTSEIADTIAGLSDNVTDHVTRICGTMFMLFDYKEFDRSIYADIVDRFREGQVT